VFFCAAISNGFFMYLLCFGVCDVLWICFVLVFFVDLFRFFARFSIVCVLVVFWCLCDVLWICSVFVFFCGSVVIFARFSSVFLFVVCWCL